MSDLTAAVLKLGSEPSDERWLDLAERAFVDTVAVLVAGATEPAVSLVAGLVDERSGPAMSLATGRVMSARSAALVDGVSAHVLDYDDVDDALIAHPSAVLVPALLAAGQEHDVSGIRLLNSYRVGLQASRAIASALGIGSHYAAGWHPTSTIGTVAAAAATAHLLDLDESTTRNALGIAGSLAGGSRQNFGTMTKPLHVGNAASQGLWATQLAWVGFTADADMLDGPVGFLALHSGIGTADAGPTQTQIPADLLAGVDVKLFPCCYATHAAVEAAVEVAGRLPGGTETIDQVDVEVQPGGMVPLIHHRPVDGTQGKFSMEYAVAVALLDRDMTLSSFADERATRADVQTLLRKVRTREAAEAAPGAAWCATVTISMTDGSTFTERVNDPIGHASRPLTEEQLRAKFDDCLARTHAVRTVASYDVLRGLRQQASVRAVVQTVTGVQR